MPSSKNTKLLVGGLIALGVGAVAILMSSEASAEEPFIPEEEDDPPVEDPEAIEEIPEPEVVEELKKQTGTDVGEEGWTFEKVNQVLGSLGYTGSAGTRLRQFQRDCRVNPLRALLLAEQTVATDLASTGMSKVDAEIGPRTTEQLNRVALLAVTLKWRTAFVGIGGNASFFESLQKLGYNVTRNAPESSTKAFQRDAKAQLNMPSLRTDGNVDMGTINALAAALMKNATGNWTASA